MTQVDFAKLISVRGNTVSRYECGRLIPGRVTLLHLYQLANETERVAIELEIKRQMEGVAFGREGAMLDVLPLLGDPRGAIANLPDGLIGAVAVELLTAVNVALYSPASVDRVLVHLLELWAAHGQHKSTLRHFKNVVVYLRVQLEFDELKRTGFIDDKPE